MGKFLVRITVVLVGIYFLVAFLCAQFIGVDILNDYHVLPFELCVVVYCYSEGKYHCQFMKYTAVGIFTSDLLSRIDNSINFFTVSEHNLVCFCLVFVSMGMTIVKALAHFYKVNKVKRKRNKLWKQP
jgi:hypothetical protein